MQEAVIKVLKNAGLLGEGEIYQKFEILVNSYDFISVKTHTKKYWVIPKQDKIVLVPRSVKGFFNKNYYVKKRGVINLLYNDITGIEFARANSYHHMLIHIVNNKVLPLSVVGGREKSEGYLYVLEIIKNHVPNIDMRDF